MITITDLHKSFEGNHVLRGLALTIYDGETIVISGFTKQKKDSSTYGVPWFKEIPLLGWLFKQEDKNESMEEVLIFITPNIIKPQIVSGIQEGT